jgi:uncharacterized protein
MLTPLPLPAQPATALAAHAAMVAQLRRPGACGGHPDAAGLIETHLSSLLLAGGHVYKLKKPVSLPFVDFSTGARRQAACNEELRLNRRTAPRWYLDVVPVQRVDGAAVIGAPGQGLDGAVIDWAVRMRRFDNRQTFDRLASEGRLGDLPGEHQSDCLGDLPIDRLAEAVAAFHAAQPPLAVGPGHAEATCQAVRDNATELAALVAGSPLAAPVVALQRWSRAAEQPALMARRARDGCVRDGHGDLHLGNVFWADGVAVLFDALEFDARLRQIDTIGDLAFTFMDLLAHGLPQAGWRFISATLDASGDWGALPLLAWWAVHRAAVRAKVALLSVPAGADTATQAAVQEATQARARRYLDVAAALAAPRRPQLVLMMGLSGSGKTAVAGQLAAQLGGVRLRSDVERKRLFGLAPTARVDPAAGLYTADATRRTYARLLALAEGALQAGVPVVIDAASLHRAERDAVRALAQRLGLPFKLLLCEAPTAVLQQRLADRQAGGQDASDATAEVLAQQLRITEWPGDDEQADLLRLATDVAQPLLAAAIQALPLG